jgi:multidrug efflux pump subunit AcrA (membrane-fusion protein)
VPVGQPRRALLVTERALDSDQGQRILYVVNDQNEVVSRPVRLGPLHDGLRVIEDGLTAGERVIVNGLQYVRPGIVVEPKLVDMPVPPAAGDPAKSARAVKSPGPAAKSEQP